MRAKRNGYTILVVKSERKRPVGRPRRRWEDNINKKSWEELIVYFPLIRFGPQKKNKRKISGNK
jgi:hypothetical protein